MSRKKTHEYFLAEMSIKHPNIEIKSRYTSARNRIECKCMIDGYEWSPVAYSLSSGFGCPKCSGNAKITHKDFISELSKINKNIEVLNTYDGMKNKILCRCKIHKLEWYDTPSNLIHGKRGCPECGKLKRALSLSLTQDEFQRELDKYNVENNFFWKTNDIYKNNRTKMNFVCSKDGYTVNVSWANLHRGGIRCNECNKKFYYLKLEDHIAKNELPIKIIGEYINSITPIKCVCKICKEEFYIIPNNILSQNSIHRKCANKIKGQKYIIPLNEFLKRLKKNNSCVEYMYGYHGTSYSAHVKCKKCGYIWCADIGGLLRGNGCPHCNNFKGEKYIAKILQDNDIKYEIQKTFNDLKGIGGYKLRYDFYLPNNNLLIEYQGIQHEKPVDFAGKGIKFAENLLSYQKEHDDRKREYAKKHNIKLLEIWYWDFDNIEIILNSEVLGK